jgi:hypothetical protein
VARIRLACVGNLYQFVRKDAETTASTAIFPLVLQIACVDVDLER